jgi:HD-GYP domain-containing protein (c-di-GMP phosphodiesterase class II)
MLRVSMHEAEVGMTLSMPVLHPEHPERTLLKPGFVLSRGALRRLESLHVTELWIEYPPLSFVAKYISPAVLRHRGAVTGVVRDVLHQMSRDAQADIEYATFRDTIRDFARTLSYHRPAALMVQSMANTNRPLVRHHSDTCYLALLLGMKLEHYLIVQRPRLSARRALDVVDLGVGAMLHDVGMLELEQDVVDDWIAQNHCESHEGWRSHVDLGYRRLKGGLEPAAIAGVMHHHQHFDGSGFPMRDGADGVPRALAGEDIHIFARIICAADLYDRLHHPPGRRDTQPAVRTLATMMQPPYRDWLDPVVMRALLGVVPAYAPGTQITLSDGRPGVIADWRPDAPCRPRIHLIGSNRGKPDVDLLEQRDVAIAEVDGHDVLHDNFDLEPANTASAVCAGTTVRRAAS